MPTILQETLCIGGEKYFPYRKTDDLFYQHGFPLYGKCFQVAYQTKNRPVYWAVDFSGGLFSLPFQAKYIKHSSTTLGLKER